MNPQISHFSQKFHPSHPSPPSQPSEANHRANRIQCHIYMSIGEVQPMLRIANSRVGV